MKIASTTPKASNAYASAAQFTLSPDWATRRTFPSGTYDWTEVTWIYKTLVPQTKLDDRFLMQDTGTIWIDDSNWYARNLARVRAALTKLEAL